MKRHDSQNGFSLLEVGVIIVVLALVGFIGFRVWTATHQPEDQQVAQTSGDNAPEIRKTADLDTANQALDSREVDASSLEQLDNELDY
jgi:type II secretory pathway pseudopilin PulG